MLRIITFLLAISAKLGIPNLIVRFIVCYFAAITLISLWQAVDPASAHNSHQMVDYGAEVMQDYLADSPRITYFLETAKFSLVKFITPWVLRYGLDASYYSIFYLLFTFFCAFYLSAYYAFVLFGWGFWFLQWPGKVFYWTVEFLGRVVWFFVACLGAVGSGVVDAVVLVVDGGLMRGWRGLRWVWEHRWDEPGSPTWARGPTKRAPGGWNGQW